MTRSLVMTVPAARVDDANRLFRALGHDEAPDPGRTFSVEMSPDSAPSPTHYACHWWAPEAVRDMVRDKALLGRIDWAAFGLTATRAQQALDAIRFLDRALDEKRPVENFLDHAAREGLKRVVRDEAV